MDQRIVQFISVLRAYGVRISLAESADAFQAVDHLGIQDRESFRISLRSTLIKDARDMPRFDELFPLFFQSDQPPAMTNATQDMSPEDAKKLAQAMQQFTEKLRKMMEKMINGEPLSEEEMRQMDQLLNMDPIDDMRMQNQLARQMEQALQFPEVRKALKALMQMLEEMGMNKKQLEKLREAIQANQEALQEQLQQHAGERIFDKMAQQKHQDQMDGLYNRPFNNLSDSEMQQLRHEITRLAAALRTRMALRLKRARDGQLDVKGTIRANLKYQSVPIELKHRDHTLKPRIVILCDVSTSMRNISEMMLSLLYAIQDQISKTHAFAFIDHLEYVSPDLQGRDAGQAVSEILHRMPSGYYNTDLGNSLNSFDHDYRDTVDRHSTFIIVGDGRNNYKDPRLDIFREIARRARSTIWLNPEPPILWGSGDSDMLKYAPLCSRTFQVNNLAQLAEAIDHMLLQS